jgi:hypothetical protein
MIFLPFLMGILLFGSPVIGVCLVIMYLTES